jgi:hypothetical protein
MHVFAQLLQQFFPSIYLAVFFVHSGAQLFFSEHLPKHVYAHSRQHVII